MFLRNLIYHVCPLTSNELWRVNCAQLRRRLEVFNGRRIIAIALGPGLHPPAIAEQELPDCEYLHLANDRQLREVATFLPLLDAIASPAADQVSFYAHTKGNSTACSVEGATLWRNAMYHHLLDRWEECQAELAAGAPAVGTTRVSWGRGRPPYPSGLRHGTWCFAGTFWWFRHDRVFTHPRWRDVPKDRYGAEAWLAGLFDAADCPSVFQPWPDSPPAANPYEPRHYDADLYGD